MTHYIVTVIPKESIVIREETHKKRGAPSGPRWVGPCPLSDECDDVLGRHHSIVISTAASREAVRDFYSQMYWVTRVEEASHIHEL